MRHLSGASAISGQPHDIALAGESIGISYE